MDEKEPQRDQDRAKHSDTNRDPKSDENRDGEPQSEKVEPKARKSADASSRLGGGRHAGGGKKEKWKSMHNHLDKALNQWNDISEQMKGELSPDQKQLQEVKSLLQQLKTKLDQF